MSQSKTLILYLSIPSLLLFLGTAYSINQGQTVAVKRSEAETYPKKETKNPLPQKKQILQQKQDQQHTRKLRQLTRIKYNFRHYLQSKIPFDSILLKLDNKESPLIQYNNGFSSKSQRPLASLTKLFTAVAILQLHENNVINLDDDIGKYFPKLHLAESPRDGKTVRIRHLLHHTTGIPYRSSHNSYVNCPVRGRTAAVPYQFAPAGKLHNYSNSNFYLLACIIEKVTRRSFPDYISHYIFAALDMNNSRISRHSMGASGIYSTAYDLTVFAQGLIDYELISYNSLKELASPPQHLKSTKNSRYYALGARVITRNHEVKDIYHTGIFNGNFAELHIYPATKSVAVIFGNPPNIHADGFKRFRWVVNRYLRKYMSAYENVTKVN
jgi:CubicO group peptidase (beta-lactamase class C family)